MREIKFRAWSGTIKKMVYQKLAMSKMSRFFRVFENDSNSVLMQYTGLKDRNGVEIYEDDILRTKHGSIFSNRDIVEYHLWAYRNSMAFTTIEVIGNIHQNPELLK